MNMLMIYPSIITTIDEALAKVGISLFGIMIAIGLGLFIWRFFRVMDASGRTKRINDWHFFILLLSLVGLLCGAWLFDHLFHYFESGIWSGGITYEAGFLIGILAFFLLEKAILKTKIDESYEILNLIIPGVPLAQALGRIGCFTAGCCYGKETTSVLGVIFPQGTVAGDEHPGVKLHPTQLYESFFCLLLFLFLAFAGKKNKWIKNHAFALYLVSYGAFRLILELFFRGDDRGELLGMAPSAFISIVMILVGIALFIFVKEPVKRKEQA